MKRLGVMLAACLLAGCVTTDFFRLQSEDEEKQVKDKDKAADTKTVGDVTTVWGAHPVRVYGVGVVAGLQGTGSDPQPDEYHRMVIHDLKQRGMEDPIRFLASPNTAVVLVSAVLTPGLRKGDAIDVEVELPPRDRATSLRGGRLLPCELREYADSHQLRGNEGPHTAIRGKVMANAAGPILVGASGDGSDKDKLRAGRIWSGCTALIDRNFMLLMNQGNQDARTAKNVSDRINERFYGQFRGTQRGMAEAKTNQDVTLKVPPQYRLNWPRYLRVIRQIPLRDNPTVRASYRQDVLRDLLDPSRSIAAALKLEALGTESVGDLKNALTHKHPLVRFCAAESPAYLSEPGGAETLADLIEEEPRLQAYALTALASLDEAISHVALRRLLASPSARTRYGAFRALRALDEKEPSLNEEVLNEKFSLHRVALESQPMVHISTSKRAEVVLFGHTPTLQPPFSLQAGPEFAVTAREGDPHCVVARFSARNGNARDYSSLKLEDVIRKLAEQGAGYSDVVELVQQIGRSRVLSCRVEVDALPESVSVVELALAGAVDKAAEEASKQPDTEEREDTADFGLLPNLFALPTLERKRPNP